MRKLILAAWLLMPICAARADVLTESGSLISSYASTENGYILVYSFAPLSISGTITNFQLSFTGSVHPQVGGATGIDANDTISSVIVKPSASFASVLLHGPNIGFANNPNTVEQPITLPYNNITNSSIANFAVPISLIGNSGPGVPNDTFMDTNQAAVSLGVLSPPIVIEPVGSLAGFPGGVDVDQSIGIGTLILSVTFIPVPEPVSLALLSGALGMTAAIRHRRQN